MKLHTAAWLAGLAALPLVVAACGGGGGDGGNGGRGQLSDPASVPTATLVPEDELTVVQIGDGSIVDYVGTGGGDGQGGGGATYTVQSGDSCNAIAQSNGISVDDLLQANPGIDANCSNLVPGEELTIPGAPPGSDDEDPDDDEGADGQDAGDDVDGDGDEQPATDSGQAHTVQSGDTCNSIAGQYGISEDDLRAANPHINAACNNLMIGEDLEIPAD